MCLCTCIYINTAFTHTCSSFALPEDSTLPQLKCKTEKDTHGRLNYRTAGTVPMLDLQNRESCPWHVLSPICHFTGILAGIHPCGVITLVGELFGAESKGQVYGLLHTYLSENESHTKSLRENINRCICVYVYGSKTIIYCSICIFLIRNNMLWWCLSLEEVCH